MTLSMIEFSFTEIMNYIQSLVRLKAFLILQHKIKTRTNRKHTHLKKLKINSFQILTLN